MIARAFGLHFRCLRLDEAVSEIVHLSKEGTGQLVVTANVDTIILTRDVPEFNKAVQQATIVVADGMPIVWYSRLTGLPLRERITGADLMPALCKAAAEKDLRVMLFGGRPEVASMAATRLKDATPGIKLHAYSPPMGFENDRDELGRAISEVNQFEPHILFVSLGQPRQEQWVVTYRNQMRFGVAIGVGAGIDFAAGQVARAPMWMRDNGLEWLFRLTQEPGRLWKRYLVRDMRILALMARDLSSRILQSAGRARQ